MNSGTSSALLARSTRPPAPETSYHTEASVTLQPERVFLVQTSILEGAKRS